MSFQEQALIFTCEDEQLIGIVSQPDEPQDCGVLIIVGGPQYRAGSHRQFVLLARYLASQNISAMRFDYRGMGDSEGQARNFEDVSTDIAAAINAFQSACPNLKKIVLWGLCDAATAALLYWQEKKDSRISGLCLLNPWIRSETTLARTHVKHYYGQRLLQKEFWKKLISGQITVHTLKGLLATVRLSFAKHKNAESDLSFQVRMALALRSFPGKVLLILSERDYTAKEFVEYQNTHPAWSGVLALPGLSRCDVAEADHTFSNVNWRCEVEKLTLQLLRALA